MKTVAMKKITMYASRRCPYCKFAEALLKEKGVNDIEKIDIENDETQRAAMISITNRRTIPQIFIGEFHVGGYDDLVVLDRAGKLDELLLN